MSEQETKVLLAPTRFRTHEMLLAALGHGLKALTTCATNYIMVEGHGREIPVDNSLDVKDSVGWFTTMHPVALEVSSNIMDTISNVSSSRGQGQHNGIGFGVVQRNYAHKCPVSFNYLGQLTTSSAMWSLDQSLCGVSKGDQTSDSLIDATFYCADGCMTFSVVSSLNQQTTQTLVKEVRQQLQMVASSLLSQHTTASYLPEFDPYIIINSTEVGPTLFILPPGEGGAESYLNNISKHLHPTRLVIFNNIHLHTKLESFEALASFYLKYIKQLQPSGPYHLLGWSFGGVISLALSMKLAAEGDSIANLFFIDSYFNLKRASSDIGQPQKDDILDPINYYFCPTNSDLQQMLTKTRNIVLFKAVKENTDYRNEEQQRLFDYYAQSKCNNLDTLLPISSLSVELLQEDSHHSWVRNKDTVLRMSSHILELIFPKVGDISIAIIYF